MKIASVIKTIQGQYGKGPFAFIRFFYYSFFRFNNFILFELDLASEPVSFELEPEYQFGSLSLDDLEVLRKGKVYPREFYMDTIGGFRNNQVVLKDGYPVYIHWLLFPGDAGRFTRIKTGTVELTHLFSLPSERGKRLARKALAAAATMLKEDGYERLVAVVHEGNIASIKTFEAMRFKPVKDLKALGQLNFKVDI